MSRPSDVLNQMQARISDWDSCADGRATFLSCYRRMTGNMVSAISDNEFRDAEWVSRLMRHFADYYFVALDAYEQDAAAAPPVWRIAHQASCDPKVSPLQRLLLGVNAHINYDLVFALDDLLSPEWPALPAERREVRYQDHCHVNEVIARTIDAVQDEILEPAMPVMKSIDFLMGPLDEYLISHLIRSWRQTVWQNAERLRKSESPEARDRVARDVEEHTLVMAQRIL